MQLVEIKMATEREMNEEEVYHELFETAMKGQWDKVVEVYQKNSNAKMAKLTKSEDTALHLAVRDGLTDIVHKLVNSLPEAENEASKILEIENEGGNNPLHLAAAVGNVDMCWCIAEKHPNLIRARNAASETPLFLAAHNGKQEAFLCLHGLWEKESGQELDYTPCRKGNGDTILHSAIFAEYFSLAYQIISYYPKLVNYVNENGSSPLHILASKPNVFRSSNPFRLIDRIIYQCVFVGELKKESPDYQAYLNKYRGGNGVQYPENYRTCMDFYKLLRNSFQVLTSPRKDDEENSQQKRNVSQEDLNSSIYMFTLHSVDFLWQAGEQARREDDGDHSIPPNCSTWFLFFELVMKALLIILGLGIGRIKKIAEKKESHVWAHQIMNELVECASTYKYDYNGRTPHEFPMYKAGGGTEVPTLPPSTDDHDQNKRDLNGLGKMRDLRKKETPLLIAAKMGIAEMVEKILDTFPVAILDLDSNKKNVVLLAVENRQAHVYNLLLKSSYLKESVLRQVDDQGNSALHLASMFGEHQPWLIPGAALQMQWEIKWYRFVKHSMPHQFFVHHNKRGESPSEIFTCTHQNLVKNGSKWLIKTSESCSVVAALIATVAFATSATVPGGVDQNTGVPILGREPAFVAFSISSLIALCFSVTALVFFLAILTSRCQEKDFHINLPRKLLLGLTSLFTSIASMLVSFCAAHFFLLKDELKSAALPVYELTCLPVTIFGFAQLTLYVDLMWAFLTKVPQRSCKLSPH